MIDLQNKIPKILVVGDLMIDHYLWGSSERISPEAPVPVVNVGSESTVLGGAGNVINNLNNKFTLNNQSAISTILIFGPIVEIIKNDVSKIIDSIDKVNCELSIWDNKLIIRSIAHDNYELKKTLNFILENIIYDKLPKSWYL